MQANESNNVLNPTPLEYFKDYYKWSASWMGEEKDRAIGDAILQEYVPFIESLAQHGLAKRTIKMHMLNLWALGSAIIEQIQDEPVQKNWPAKKLLLEYLHDEGGPLLRCWDPGDGIDIKKILAYDSSCRKFYQFMNGQK